MRFQRNPVTKPENILTWVSCVFGLTAVLQIAGVLLHRRIIQRLRSRHHVLWLDLGAPTLWDATFTVIGRTPDFSSSAHLTYRGWLAVKGFADIADDVVKATGERLRWLGSVSLAWFGLLVIGGLWIAYGR
jgi:hypothetical protein